MTTGEQETQEEARLAPADVHDVRFPSGTVLHPGYSAADVDRFLARTALELARLQAEKAELLDQVHALSADAEEAVHEAPTDQAARLLSTAQQTADAYVAEAEEFSRQVTADARAQAEEELRNARETAGAIIQAAHEAAARMVPGGGSTPVGDDGAPGATKEQLEKQVADLRAFAQACRLQLRSYLEALLTDVENEWGRADPAGLPIRMPEQRVPSQAAEQRQPVKTQSKHRSARASDNVAREMPLSDSTSEHPVVTADGVEMLDQRG